MDVQTRFFLHAFAPLITIWPRPITCAKFFIDFSGERIAKYRTSLPYSSQFQHADASIPRQR